MKPGYHAKHTCTAAVRCWNQSSEWQKICLDRAGGCIAVVAKVNGSSAAAAPEGHGHRLERQIALKLRGLPLQHFDGRVELLDAHLCAVAGGRRAEGRGSRVNYRRRPPKAKSTPDEQQFIWCVLEEDVQVSKTSELAIVGGDAVYILSLIHISEPTRPY